MIIKRPAAVSRQTLVSLLVIALTTVISAKASSVSEPDRPVVAGPNSKEAPVITPEQNAKDSGAVEARAEVPTTVENPKSTELLKAPEAENTENVKSAASVNQQPAASVEALESGSEASHRKGRAEQSTPPSSSPAASPATGISEAASKPVVASEKSATSASPAKLEPKAALAKPLKPAPLVSKSAAKSKLPANLGTVTSTGSGGPAHYMSKHDAYSAIAEKHGALAQDAMRKSDKRNQLQHFAGIQKASGLGDMFSPFKGVSDSGLARTLGASMRSIMKSKYSVPAYVASALLGAVALLAFYESPISPLPVPPLPEPPVGRFPPEMPNISPNAQVPFRTNQQQYGQQQNYNQRSYNGLPQQIGNLYQQQQQQQQVLFPGSNNAQQRQMGPISSSGGPVQQLAANLLSVGKQQIAQRKSSPDYDQQPISRSLFNSGVMGPSPKMSGAANQQKQNSFLGFFGLGGGSNSAPSPSTAPTSGESQQLASASSPAGSTSGQSSGSGPSSESKNQAAVTANGLSNSHLVNKVKSYFTRASPNSAISLSSSSSANSNPYDQYQRMSFVQALMKDTAFLPAFLSPSRKSSSSPSLSSSSSNSQSSASNKAQSMTNAIPSGGNSPAAARMQVDGIQSISNSQIPPIGSKQRPASSGYGLVRTADRIAHALLETFTSGIAQRSAPNSNGQSDSDRKSSHSDDDQGNQAASLATSLISDIVSSYSANVANSIVDQSQQQSDQQAKSAQQHQSSSQQSGSSSSSQTASARSSDDSDEDHIVHSNVGAASAQINSNNKQNNAPLPAQSSNHDGSQGSAPHVRKTRSIGFEYPVETNHELAMREQQPSKAAQINNVIDFVADSYTHNRLLFNFVMNQVGLSQAVPYVEQILASGGSDRS